VKQSKKKPEARRPKVICHMTPSVDGRIDGSRWPLTPKVISEYERTAGTFGADAWMIGRISMEPYAGKSRVPKRKAGAPIARTDFVARRAGSYVVALDPSGKLTWTKSDIDGEHVISVLTEGVSDDYLAFLQARGVSYVFGGKRDVDLKRALEKLRSLFDIRLLLLEGGGKINGSFLAADLIDELSILMAPIADGAVGTPALFDAPGRRRSIRNLKLLSHQKRAGDLLWLRYAIKRR
jgi:riboflavin biosynthesis pyrimidine reductase